jgi:hypothetical protein
MLGPRLPRLSPHRNNSSTESLRSRGFVTAEDFTDARPCAVKPVVAGDFADKRLCVSVPLLLYPSIPPSRCPFLSLSLYPAHPPSFSLSVPLYFWSMKKICCHRNYLHQIWYLRSLRITFEKTKVSSRYNNNNNNNNRYCMWIPIQVLDPKSIGSAQNAYTFRSIYTEIQIQTSHSVTILQKILLLMW